MISKVARVKSSSAFCIKSLSDYLRLGHKDEPKLENERVKSFFTLNMKFDDLDTATFEMMRTASLNTRSQCPKYLHLVLSLSEGENLDDDTWKKICFDYLDELNMKNHQVIAVRHDDNGKDHLHLIINRIETEKHTRTNSYNKYLKLHIFDKKIEEKYNLMRFDHKANEKTDYQRSALNHAIDIEKKSEHQTLLTFLLEHKDEILSSVLSWKELQNKLFEFDCQIAVKGRGLVIRSLNPEHKQEVKASSFDRSFSYKKLVEKLGLPPTDLNQELPEEEQKKKKKKQVFVEIPLTKNAKRIDYTEYFFKKIEERGDRVIDKGDRLIIKKHNDRRTLYDSLKIAKKRFGNGHIEITGNRKFQLEMMTVALKMHIEVSFSNPEIEKLYTKKFFEQQYQEQKLARLNQEIFKEKSKKQIEIEKQRKIENDRQNRRIDQQHSESGRNSRKEERSKQPDFHR